MFMEAMLRRVKFVLIYIVLNNKFENFGKIIEY